LAAVDFSNPQSWNRYSYALNNPLNFMDPSGLCTEEVNGDYYSNGDSECPATPAPAPLDMGYTIYTTAYDFYDSSITGLGLFLDTFASLGGFPGLGFSPALGATGPGPNNGPQSINWKKVGSCLVDSTLKHYGLDALTAGSGALAIPISKSLVPPFRMIGEPTTNLLSVLGHYVEINVPRITIDGLASTNLLRIAGRANPYVAGALLAIDVGMISYDTYQCHQKQ
jgi:hypothetical protein